MDSDRRRRARARAARITLRRGSEPAPDQLTPEQAVALVHELTLAAWSLSGRPLPSYTRAEAPVRVLRPDPTDDVTPD